MGLLEATGGDLAAAIELAMFPQEDGSLGDATSTLPQGPEKIQIYCSKSDALAALKIVHGKIPGGEFCLDRINFWAGRR